MSDVQRWAGALVVTRELLSPGEVYRAAQSDMARLVLEATEDMLRPRYGPPAPRRYGPSLPTMEDRESWLLHRLEGKLDGVEWDTLLDILNDRD